MNQSSLRILFVEDVPDDAGLAERALKREGLIFDATRVETQEDFIAALDNFKPDVIISDYSMPTFDGMRALKLAQHYCDRIPFIVLTGPRNEETAVACLKAGATDYVLKDHLARLPFAVREALDQYHNVLAKESAEQTLRESERFYRLLFEQAGDYALILDLDSRQNPIIVDANEEALRVHGFTREELIGKPITLLEPDMQPDMAAERLRHINNHAPYTFTTQHRRKDGTRIDIEARASIVSILGDTKILSIERDITERKKAEDALRASEARLKAVFDLARVAIGILDPTGKWIQVNQRTEELLGYSVGELRRLNYVDVTHVDDIESSRQGLRDLLNGKLAEYHLEKRLIHKDGTIIWVDQSVTAICDVEGKPISFITAAFDITERKQAEYALRDSEERYRHMFAGNSASMLLIDPKTGAILEANTAASRYYGYSIDQLRQMYIDAINTLAREQINAQMQEAQNRKTNHFVSQHRLASGEYRDVEVYWTPISVSGQVLLQSIVHDITERKRAEESLRQNESKYRSLFENATIALWEEDFSHAKNFLGQLGDWKTQDIHEYLETHPEQLQQCANLVKVVNVNQESRRLFPSIPSDGLEHYKISNHFVSESWQVFKEEMVALMQGETKFEGESPFLNGAGKISPSLFRMSVVPGYEQTLARVLVSFVDITERQEMEEELASLSRRLFEAQETERRYIAHELHDEIGQVLTAVKSNLQTSKLLTDPEMSASFLNESIGIVDQAMLRVRDLSLNLRPSMLDDFGLVPALEWYLNRQASRWNLEAEFIADPHDMLLPQALATTCFRVTQAALTNVERHAKAKRVRVDLRLHRYSETGQGKKSELILAISDDGVGFEVEKALENAKHGKTLGLTSMQERVRLAGGQMNIHSHPLQGTEIIVQLPIP